MPISSIIQKLCEFSNSLEKKYKNSLHSIKWAKTLTCRCHVFGTYNEHVKRKMYVYTEVPFLGGKNFSFFASSLATGKFSDCTWWSGVVDHLAWHNCNHLLMHAGVSRQPSVLLSAGKDMRKAAFEDFSYQMMISRAINVNSRQATIRESHATSSQAATLSAKRHFLREIQMKRVNKTNSRDWYFIRDYIN